MNTFLVRWGLLYRVGDGDDWDWERDIYAHVDGWFFNWRWRITADRDPRGWTLASGRAWTQAGAAADAMTAAHDAVIIDALHGSEL